MIASDYPITTPYGQVAGYPLNNGFHNGIDYGCPSGTPVVVNGVNIGLSGETGYVTGPHLHVGRWINGVVTDPGVGNGFNFRSATVTQVSNDAINGNYVRLLADGASWVYLHLSKQLVTVGEELKGDTMVPTADLLNALFVAFLGRPANATEQTQFVNKISYNDLIPVLNDNNVERNALVKLIADGKAAETVTQLKPGTYRV